MSRSTVAFVAGLVFALGLGISGMTLPAKVVGFLDVFGAWDPSLAFVMIGAIGVNVLARVFVGHKTKPSPGPAHAAAGIDRALLVGAALFGLGWGLVGYCPGPAVLGLVTLQPPVLLFCAAMAAGMLLFRRKAQSS